MQRRIDLALMLDYELSQLKQRFEMLKRTAHEIGASDSVLAQWQQQIDDIAYEVHLRSSDDDAQTPPA